ncbi:uncharacterized protein C17orf53 homolog isoform X2 [Suricata suricatta]|nr:uncharacterized protein C17orf53 homolog isoform X2 [Suricata suricatta]
MNAGSLRPGSSRPQDIVLAQASGQPPSCPTASSEALGPSSLGLRLPISSVPGAIRGPPSTGRAPLRPVSTSSSWTGHHRRVTLTEALQEPARPPTSASRPLLPFESQQEVISGFEGPEQDDFDKVLASMEPEGPGLEPGLGTSSESTGILATWQPEDSASAKKARVADMSGSCQKGPPPASHAPRIGSAHDEPPAPSIRCGTALPLLRPGAVSSLPTLAASALPAEQPHSEACPKGPALRAPLPVQSSPRNRFPGQSFHYPNACLRGKSPLHGPGTPNSICPTPSRTNSASFPRSPLQPRAPVSSVRCPTGPPENPRSSLVPQAVLQTPIVTNHLVQLVTAASRTPQHLARTKTRRFPGPAGILPHQHSGKNLEEIMVSTPQTPTHGALAKFRAEMVTSSQASAEEDFGRGPWLAMKSTLGLDERDPTCFLCTYSIVMVLRKAALKQLPRNKVPSMAVMVKSLSRSTMDASVVFKDPTGEMQGTLHRSLLEARQSELKPGSVLLLKQVGVFSPSLRNHYLNVTPNNLVRIYSPDSGDGNLTPSQPFPKDPSSISGILHHETAESQRGRRAAPSTEAGVPPEAALPEADDLDGLLSELPEDFFCGTSSWHCPEARHPP